MRLLLLAVALAVATCRHGDPTGPGPTPAPVPWPVPDGGDDDAGPAPTPTPAPAPIPSDACESALEHLRELECPPTGGSDAWAKTCPSLSSNQLSCVLATDVCATARACLE